MKTVEYEMMCSIHGLVKVVRVKVDEEVITTISNDEKVLSVIRTYIDEIDTLYGKDLNEYKF